MNTDDEENVHSPFCIPSALVCSRKTEGHVWGRAVHQSVCGKRSWDPHPGRPAQRWPAENTGRWLHQLVSWHTEMSQRSHIITCPAPHRFSACTTHVVSVAVLMCHSSFLLYLLIVITDYPMTQSHPGASSVGVPVTVNNLISHVPSSSGPSDIIKPCWRFQRDQGNLTLTRSAVTSYVDLNECVIIAVIRCYHQTEVELTHIPSECFLPSATAFIIYILISEQKNKRQLFWLWTVKSFFKKKKKSQIFSVIPPFPLFCQFAVHWFMSKTLQWVTG